MKISIALIFLLIAVLVAGCLGGGQKAQKQATGEQTTVTPPQAEPVVETEPPSITADAALNGDIAVSINDTTESELLSSEEIVPAE